MSSDFKSRFMNRMEHITKTGHTSSQRKSSTPTTNINLNNNFGIDSNRQNNGYNTSEFSQQIPNADNYPNTPTAISVNSYQPYNPNNSKQSSNMSNMIANNFFNNTNSQQQQQYDSPPSYHQEFSSSNMNNNNNKMTAQQFQNYLNDFSPPPNPINSANINHNNPSSISPEQTGYPFPLDNFGLNGNNINNNIINADFTQNQNQNRYETASEDFHHRYHNKMKVKKMRASTNSARPLKKKNKNQRGHPGRHRQVSLEFSKKPRKIQYKPYSLNDLQSLTVANIGSGRLGPDLEDEDLQLKTKNYSKVREYAEIVNMKNKQHRPKPKIQPMQSKSKQQIAREYASNVNKLNRQRFSHQLRTKSLNINMDDNNNNNYEVAFGHGYKVSPRFKMTGNAALNSTNQHGVNYTRSKSSNSRSKSKEMSEKLAELQQLHMRNRAIAQRILNDTFT